MRRARRAPNYEKKGAVGKMLREARKKIPRLFQQEVASRVGVTPAYICKLEKGENPPSAELCVKLAEILKLDALELQKMAWAEREGVDLAALIVSIKDDPLAGLDSEEAKLVREWRKLDDHWKERIINLILKAQEMLGLLEETEEKLKK